MIGLLMLAAAMVGVSDSTEKRGPEAVTISTSRGEVRLVVREDPLSGPQLSAPALLSALQAGVPRVSLPWAEVRIANRPFRFLIGAGLVSNGSVLQPLAGTTALRGDTLFVPLQFVTEVLPQVLGDRFRYDRASARLTEFGGPPTTTAPLPAATPEPARLPNGLRTNHVVTVDPGHGGVDPGNPGLYFPKGVREKDVNLQVGLLLRDELKRRGIGVRMTRTTDTLIDIRHRGGYCSEDCDLFVSLHVNSLPRRTGYTTPRGFETYFLAEARTEDAARVARMENEAIRFEAPADDAAGSTGLDFLLRDLQLNEYLRESARIAQIVQDHLATAHSGANRGVKQAGLFVLTTARRPAVLVELGFSTNPADGRLLSQPSSQRALAYALADAVVSYLLEYERRAGASPDSGRGR